MLQGEEKDIEDIPLRCRGNSQPAYIPKSHIGCKQATINARVQVESLEPGELRSARTVLKFCFKYFSQALQKLSEMCTWNDGTGWLTLMTVTCLCLSKLFFDTSGLGLGSGFSRIFSIIKLWTFLTASAAPIMRQTRSVVPENRKHRYFENSIESTFSFSNNHLEVCMLFHFLHGFYKQKCLQDIRWLLGKDVFIDL